MQRHTRYIGASAAGGMLEGKRHGGYGIILLRFRSQVGCREAVHARNAAGYVTVQGCGSKLQKSLLLIMLRD